jgi:hypothetical protein
VVDEAGEGEIACLVNDTGAGEMNRGCFEQLVGEILWVSVSGSALL